MADATVLMDRILRRTCGTGVAVLDFGCGQGALVEGLRKRGYEARGCDMFPNGRADCSVIETPYRLPYPDDSFDAIVSTSVLEHAQNPEETFREWRRCLKPGGRAIHLFPSKSYLPAEPHILVPLVNLMWPHVPRWWLALWALLGVRNDTQRGLPWRDVVALNATYCRTGLNYRSLRYYRDLSRQVFGNFEEMADVYIEEADGGAARALRRLPRVVARRLARLRMLLIGMRKD